MPSDPIPTPEAARRDEAASRSDSAAPAGMAEHRHPSPRGISHPEEEQDGRGEWWSLAKAIAIGAVVIMLITWLIAG